MAYTFPLCPERFDEFDPFIQAIDDLARTPITKRKIRHYERQRREKKVLTEELARLSKIILERKEANKNTIRETKTTPEDFVWKAVAQHRLKDLLAAEAQRKWLQGAITGQTALIKDLKKVTRQHMKIANLLAAQSPSEQLGIFAKPSDDLLYAMDIQDIDDLYLQTASVFHDCNLDPTSTETTPFYRTVTKHDDTLSVQLVRRQHMLFNYEQTRQSIWMLSTMMHRQNDREDYRGIDDPENTIVTQFRVTTRLAPRTWNLCFIARTLCGA